MKKQTKKVAKKHESGRSMIEMVGVLAVMGLITAAAFVLITSALRSQKMTRVDDDVSAIAAGVRLVYGNKQDFTSMNSSNDSNTLTLIGYNDVKSPYNGKYTVYKVDDNHFGIKFTVDGKDTCTTLANRLDGVAGCEQNVLSQGECTSTDVIVKCAKYANN